MAITELLMRRSIPSRSVGLLLVLLCSYLLINANNAFLHVQPTRPLSIQEQNGLELCPTSKLQASPYYTTKFNSRIALAAVKDKGGGGSSSKASSITESSSASTSPLDTFLIKIGYKSEEGGEGATRSLKEKLKLAGISGVLAYVSSEVLFWFISLPLGIFAFRYSTGEWLDLSTSEGQAKVAGFSAGFLAFARVALPLRAAVALAITPILDKYVVRPLVEKGVIKEEAN